MNRRTRERTIFAAGGITLGTLFLVVVWPASRAATWREDVFSGPPRDLGDCIIRKSLLSEQNQVWVPALHRWVNFRDTKVPYLDVVQETDPKKAEALIWKGPH